MSATRYKVGDVVRVRNDLGDSKYGGVYTATEMMLFRGKTITIEKVITAGDRFIDDYNGHYNSEGWNWTDEMFEDYIPVADNDTDSRIEDKEISSNITIKDLFDLYK